MTLPNRLHPPVRTAIAALLLSLTLATACSTFRPFPNRDPMWVDPDQQPFGPTPEEYYSGLAADGLDQMLLRPLSNFFAVDPGGEATNVNALDEVPDSSWFTNRIGRHPSTMEEFLEGPCKGFEPIDPAGPWLVTGAKPNGENPGFIIKDAKGQGYLVKFDGKAQQPRATAADVIVTRIYHAAGYTTPCNTLVFFDRKILRISPKATSEDDAGKKVPLADKHLDKIFAKAMRLEDGRYRANASRFLPGKPLGPWRYESTRSDDYNDVVKHEDRRELRGAMVLASWVNHFDSREQNTLDTWEEVDGKRGFVRHNYIDFGDCFGSLWDWDALSRRWGHTYVLDLWHVLGDFITLGSVVRPWDEAEIGKAGEVFGYFDGDPFEPDAWQNEYPNPAFDRTTEHDAAWMARILARFSHEHIDRVVELGKFPEEVMVTELRRILKARRDRILKRWFSKLSPLSHPRLVDRDGGRTDLCLEDLAVTSGVFAPQRKYVARAWLGIELKPGVGKLFTAERPGEVCVTLPRTATASSEHPTYVVVDIIASRAKQGWVNPVRTHLYQVGDNRYRIVGLERPTDHDPPGD